MNCSFNTAAYFDGMPHTNTAEAAHILIRAAKYLAKTHKLNAPAVVVLERIANDVYRGRAVDMQAILAMIPAPKVKKNPCTRCGGVGTGNWGQVRNGVCYKCGGTGVNPPRE